MCGHINGFSLDRQLDPHLEFHPTLVLPRFQDWMQCYFVFDDMMLSTLNQFYYYFFFPQVLWLLSFDDRNTLADAVDKYCIGVPPIQWLAWIPQLLTCLVGSEGKPLLNLISQVCTSIVLFFITVLMWPWVHLYRLLAETGKSLA